MSIVPKKIFINNEIPLQFNTDSFEVTSINSDNLSGLSLDISGQSNLNNVDVIGNLNSVNIVNSGSLTSNTLTSTGALTSNSITCSNGLSSASITNSGLLTSNTITSASTLTASNNFKVSAGTVSFPANAIGTAAVNGLGSTLAKLQNLTGSVAVVSTISSNILTINYGSNNGQSIFVTPTANFSLVLTNVPTSSVQAIYKLEIYCSARFYCNAITVNGSAITMVSLGGFSNIASNVNANATELIQQFTIFFTGTTTPSRVSTMLFSTW
jgi:hypothetical protein